ncbi:hypothetical protein Trydic_g5037 [Trypoxylus dichotomus]
MSITTTEPEEASYTQHETDTYKLRNDLRRRSNFTRTSSLESIIRLNTYICSQSFFILPSILAWLRTSQTVLTSYAEKCTTTIKSAVYSSIVYKIIEAQFTIVAIAFKGVSIFEPKQLLGALNVILIETNRSLERIPENVKRKMLKATVYFSFFFIFLQLLVCLLRLSWVSVPYGLIFLLGCLATISFANFQCLRFIEIEELLKEEDTNAAASTHVSRKYIRRRDILGKRTISNVKLF